MVSYLTKNTFGAKDLLQNGAFRKASVTKQGQIPEQANGRQLFMNSFLSENSSVFKRCEMQTLSSNVSASFQYSYALDTFESTVLSLTPF